MAASNGVTEAVFFWFRTDPQRHSEQKSEDYVGGEPCISQIIKGGNGWATSRVDAEEALQQVEEIDVHIGRFEKTTNDDARPHVHAALAPNG